MIKTIEFIAAYDEFFNIVSMPVPSKKEIPAWYKKSFKFKNNNMPSFDKNNYSESTIKSCMPVLDSMSLGYIQKTWCDIYIEIIDEKIFYRWSSGPQIIYEREDWHKQLLPTPHAHHNTMLTWSRPWGIKTSKKYSCLFVHPFYHTDLPFTSMPGIIDTDKYHGSGERSVPFFIKKGFFGLIPKGTPMYQIIPIKREPWHSEIKHKGNSVVAEHLKIINTRFFDKYKKEFWNKKIYE